MNKKYKVQVIESMYSDIFTTLVNKFIVGKKIEKLSYSKSDKGVYSCLIMYWESK